MFGYVYLTKNLINGKCYIGQKHSSVFVEDYYGSGVYLKRALLKYGTENFDNTKILQWCETKESLDEAERYWIQYYNAVNNPDFYNLAKGGEGLAGCKHSDTWKSLIAESTRNREWKDESREKIRNYVKDRVWMNKGTESKQVLKKEISSYQKQGWELGRPSFSEIAKQHMSDSRKGKCYESKESLQKRSVQMTREGNHFYGKTHSDEQKAKWRVMRKEMVWINKDGKNTVIHNSKLSKYLSNGWVRGMIRNKQNSKESSETIEQLSK